MTATVRRTCSAPDAGTGAGSHRDPGPAAPAPRGARHAAVLPDTEQQLHSLITTMRRMVEERDRAKADAAVTLATLTRVVAGCHAQLADLTGQLVARERDLTRRTRERDALDRVCHTLQGHLDEAYAERRVLLTTLDAVRDQAARQDQVAPPAPTARRGRRGRWAR